MADRSLITPEKVVEVLLNPTVSVVALGVAPALPRTTLAVPAPLLASEPMFGAALMKSTVAVPVTGLRTRPPVTEVSVPNEELLVATNVPEVAMVRPL